MMKKAVVTGGAGFIGSHLVDKLIKMGISVSIIDDLSSGKIENINQNADLWKKDLATVDIDALTKYMQGVDCVFHCAAKARVQPSIENPLPFNKANVDGTLKTLIASNKSGVKKFIYSASSSCYGDTKILPTPENAPIDPLSPYALQKHIGEEYCRLFSKLYELDTVCLRYFNIYGERMPSDGSAYSLVLSVWERQYKNNEPLNITNNGNQRRDFTHVDDVVEANIIAATNNKKFNGESFNIGTGKSLSINEVADMIGREKIYGEKRIEPFETLADNKKAILKLGWKPKRNFKKFIERTFR
jgi:UDP-glucose 4-epimerase